MNWTNTTAATTIDRSQGLTGGNPGTYISITGDSVTANTGGAGPAAGFAWLAPVADGRFTVPSYILQSLSPGNGGVVVQNILYSPFSASGLALGTVSYSASSAYR